MHNVVNMNIGNQIAAKHIIERLIQMGLLDAENTRKRTENVIGFNRYQDGIGKRKKDNPEVPKY